jgi:hypothetical protein
MDVLPIPIVPICHSPYVLQELEISGDHTSDINKK